MPLRPFNMLRAAYFLIAFVIVSQVVTITVGGWTCFYMFVTKQAEIGACGGFTAQAREMWAEVIATILALIIAGRSNDNDPKPPANEP